MIRVGITGQSGFIGAHLYNRIKLLKEHFKIVEFYDDFFYDEKKMEKWVRQCDVIVHLAAMNRHNDPKELYNVNIELVNKLINAMKSAKSKAHVLFSSSTQEERNNQYGKSKKKGRELLYNFAEINNSSFSGLVIPNVFGPFGNPYYNSFIATFSHQLANDKKTEIQIDGNVKLIYVDNLNKFIIKRIEECAYKRKGNLQKYIPVPYDFEMKVSKILSLLKRYKNQYFENSTIPKLKDINEVNLFNTFRSYMNYEKEYPVKLTKHSDSRGSFTEIIKMNTSGQVSYSVTLPGITRGNHFHTRKIERFAVIKGKALIKLRRIGNEKILDFELDGDIPSFVDIPVWYTHSIKNIGNEELLTLFWINEFYNSEDPDTFFENVNYREVKKNNGKEK